MKTEKISGTMEKWDKRALPKPLDWAGEVELYESYSEIVEKSDVPNHDEVLAFRNDQRKANARAKAGKEAVDREAKTWKEQNPDSKEANPYEKATINNSADMRYKNIYDTLIAAGKSPEQADRLAKASLE